MLYTKHYVTEFYYYITEVYLFLVTLLYWFL